VNGGGGSKEDETGDGKRRTGEVGHGASLARGRPIGNTLHIGGED
jgi:hypothetical protein